MARPPSAKSIIRNLKKDKRSFEPKTPIASEMFLPNSSGIEGFSNLKRIKNWYTTNLFVDHIAEKTELHNIVFDNDVDVQGDITTTGTVDGVDVSNIPNLYLELDGSNASQHINIGVHNFTTTGTVDAGPILGNKIGLSDASRIRGYLNVNQSANSGATTIIGFDTEVYDTRGEFDIATNKGRFTADDTGYYLVCANATLDALADGTRVILYVYRNGVQMARTDTRIGSAGLGGAAVNTIIYLSATQYVDIRIYHNHGSARDILNVENRTNVSIHRLS